MQLRRGRCVHCGLVIEWPRRRSTPILRLAACPCCGLKLISGSAGLTARWSHATVPVIGGRPLSIFLCHNCASVYPPGHHCMDRTPFLDRLPHAGYFAVKDGRIAAAMQAVQ